MAQLPEILVIDDDAELCELLSELFAEEGYSVESSGDGRAGLVRAQSKPYAVVVLDIMLPSLNGFEVLTRLRQGSPEQHADVPVIMLTAKGEDVDRIVGLEMGADDYLPKPFNPRELLARAKAVLRRATGLPVGSSTESATSRGMSFEGWRLDIAKRELWSPDNVLVQLSAGEFDLLVAFVEHPQRVLTRDQLLDLARGRSAMPFDRSIDVQVSRLRRKIEPDPKEPTMIKTVRSGGYIFTPVVTGS
jgi:two-component system OmpR family response regulator